MSKTTTLDLAMSKAAALPEGAQERIAREILLRLETLEELGAEIAVGLQELDAGKGDRLDVEGIVRRAHDEHAGT